MPSYNSNNHLAQHAPVRKDSGKLQVNGSPQSLEFLHCNGVANSKLFHCTDLNIIHHLDITKLQATTSSARRNEKEKET